MKRQDPRFNIGDDVWYINTDFNRHGKLIIKSKISGICRPYQSALLYEFAGEE